MLTFYSDPSKKQERIDRHKRHIEADRLMAGCYQDEWNPLKGCSVGCDAIDISGDADGNCHKVVAEHDGVPEWLEHLRDAIFEGLPDSERAGWHLSLAEAIPVGADIEIVRHQLADWMLSDDGPMPEAVNHATVKYAIAQVRKYHQDCIGDVFESDSAAESAESAARSAAWSAARSAAWSAAESAAWSAAESAWSAAESARSAARSARSAAWSAAESAESAAWSAAWSAAESAESAESAAWSAAESARSAAWSAAESAAFSKIASKVIALLQAM